MATPLYRRGQAVPGRDGPFHALDAILNGATDQQLELHHTGQKAADFLLQFAKLGQLDRIILPIPQDCPDEVRYHECDSPENCTHEKQCGTNRRMWRPEADQEQHPYAAHLSDSLAQHLINFFIEDVQNLQMQLRDQLQSHGDLILKRWKKLSKDKRGKLLSDAAPQIFGPWPVVTARCPNDGCYEEHFDYWPGGQWFNVRDLAEDPMKLLSILHVRTTHNASAWTFFDTRESIQAWHQNKLPLWYNEQCVTMCGNKFGTLCDFDVEETHAWCTMGFPRAFLTIQLQHQLLCTLHNVTNLIVKDSPGTGAMCLESLVAGGLRTSGGDAAWNSYTHQAFTTPRSFDPKVALAKAKAQFEMIQDQLWLMQTEPGYMQAVIYSRRVALRNVVTGMHHKDHVAAVGGLLVDELIARFHLWYTVCRGLDNFQEYVEENGSSFVSGQVLPIELSAQFVQLQGLIKGRLMLAKQSFLRFLEKEPCRKGCCLWDSSTSGGVLKIEAKQGLNPYAPAGRLQWRLRTLAKFNHDNLPLNGFAYDLNAMIREDEKPRLMDKSMCDFLSDLMVLDDIHSDFRWSQCIVDREWERSELGLRWKASGCSECRVLDDQWVERISPLVTDFMEVTWPKGPKTLAWLKTAIESRHRLGLLWKSIRVERSRVSISGCKDLAQSSEIFRAAIAFDSEAGYLAQIEEEHRLYNLERAKVAATAEAQLLQEEDYRTVWKTAAENGPVCHKQTKAKAKRIAGALGTDLSQLDIGEEPQPTQTPELPAIAVKRDSLSVFRKMFTAGHQGELRWSVFVQAMVDAGFKATEASGSAVNFSNGCGSICFHRPHPDPVIDPIMLHNMARRMHKWFGWCSERFAEREK